MTDELNKWTVLAKKRLEDLTLFADRIEVLQRKQRNAAASTIQLGSITAVSVAKNGLGKMDLVLTVGSLQQAYRMKASDAQDAAAAINAQILAAG